MGAAPWLVRSNPEFEKEKREKKGMIMFCFSLDPFVAHFSRSWRVACTQKFGKVDQKNRYLLKITMRKKKPTKFTKEEIPVPVCKAEQGQVNKCISSN